MLSRQVPGFHSLLIFPGIFQCVSVGSWAATSCSVPDCGIAWVRAVAGTQDSWLSAQVPFFPLSAGVDNSQGHLGLSSWLKASPSLLV